MDGFDMLGADDLALQLSGIAPGFSTFAPPPSAPHEESWFTRPVLGPVPGWGVTAGAGGLAGLLLFIVLGK